MADLGRHPSPFLIFLTLVKQHRTVSKHLAAIEDRDHVTMKLMYLTKPKGKPCKQSQWVYSEALYRLIGVRVMRVAAPISQP